MIFQRNVESWTHGRKKNVPPTSFISYHVFNSRAMDPDSGSTFIFPPGSGSRRKKFKIITKKNAKKLVSVLRVIIMLSTFLSKFEQAPLLFTFEKSFTCFL